MCAILGMIGYVPEGRWGQTYAVLRELYLASEHRGRDATGFAALTEPLDAPLDGHLVTTKEPLTAGLFVTRNAAFRRLAHQRCACFVGHVRGPFALVHNGIVSNYREIAEDHGLRLTSQCDSEVLARLVEDAGDPALGLARALREVSGSVAVAVLDRDTGAVWLARNGRPLWLARMWASEVWFVASTNAILLRAFAAVHGETVLNRLAYLAPIPANCVLTLTPGSTVIAASATADATA
jgi:glucosamine 6-phosphate synthetase-like amidotransferase/phosphosugar isomerase protein